MKIDFYFLVLTILITILILKVIIYIVRKDIKDSKSFEKYHSSKFTNKKYFDIKEIFSNASRENYYLTLEYIQEQYKDYKLELKKINSLSTYTNKYITHSCIKDLKASIEKSNNNNYSQLLLRKLPILDYENFKISVCDDCKKVYILTGKNYL